MAPPFERLVLHIGQAKTGSTSLQRTLADHRRHLKDAGYCYPKIAGHRDAHHGLVPALFGLDRSSRYVQRLLARRPERALARSRAALDALCASDADQTPTLVLSSEAFFQRFRNSKKATVAEALRRLARRIEVVVFIREPASFYLSRIGTHLQAFRFDPVPRPRGRQNTLKSYIDIVDDMVVVPMEGRDTVRHFLGHLGLELPSTTARNVALSAEALQLCLGYAQRHGLGDGGRPSGRGLLFREVLRRVDRVIASPSELELHPHLREEVWKASTDMKWLEETFGCTFAQGHYDVAGKGSGFPFAAVDTLGALCQLNPDRLARLQRVMRPLI